MGEEKWAVFIGGMVFIINLLFVLYASTIYNNATATTNTSLIANAVIILFVTNLDKMMLSILVVIYPNLFSQRWCSRGDRRESRNIGIRNAGS